LFQAAVGKAIAYGIHGQRIKGLDLLHETQAKVEQRGVGDAEAMYKIAQAYAVLNERESALRMLRSSIANGFFCYPYLSRDHLLNNLRSQPEFEKVIALARDRHDKFRLAFFSELTYAS